ncbi:MAG: PAS domain-containing sensor histidine kinase [Gemmatimonadaceae bacterium]|nr:PAS domain-containing sensor histidine kinase [Gemmatimonadaceae bacterium]
MSSSDRTPGSSATNTPELDYRAIFAASPTAYLLVRADAPRWTILAASDEYCRITRQKRENLVGRGTFEVFPESHGTESSHGKHNVRSSFEVALSMSGRIVLPIQRYDLPPAADGDGYAEHYWRMSSAPVQGAHEGAVAVLHAVENVTEQILASRAQDEAIAAARTAEDRLRTVFSDAPVGIAVLRGPEHRFESANKSYIDVVGRGSLIGKTVREAFPDLEGQGIYPALDKAYATGTPFVAEEMLIKLDRNDDGVLLDSYFDFVYQPLRDPSGSVEGIAVIITDVTTIALARRSAEQRERSTSELNEALVSQQTELETLNAHLQEQAMEMEQRTEEAQTLSEELDAANQALRTSAESANVAREAAESANKTKADFLAAMSHELRTPLNAISGYAQLMEMGLHGPITDQQRTSLERIRRSHMVLARLVEDVLSFARIDSGHVEYNLTDVPLDALLDGVEALVSPQLELKRLGYSYCHIDSHVTVRADRDKVEQIMLNLLSNAIKFTDAGSVVVECDMTASEIKVRVRDTGRGIPANKLQSIFEPFVQVESGLKRGAGGTGLGLAISRELARGMSGDIIAESVEGDGAVFTLVLLRRN